MNINKRLGRALLACAGAVILTITMAVPAQAAPPEDGPKGSPLDKCVTAATDAQYQQWVCVGGKMHVQKEKDGKPANRDEQVADDEAPVALGSPTFQRASSTRVVPMSGGDFWDNWCETGTTCSRRINSYASETKGNAAYGNQYGSIGAFDIILTTNLNGRSGQWKVVLIWDRGPRLTFNAPTLHCRQKGFLAAIDCGNHGYNNFSTQSRYTSPTLYGRYLSSGGEYYGLFDSQFVPAGYSAFYVSPLRTSIFNCPGSGNCTFP